jgi:hypothetical protein
MNRRWIASRDPVRLVAPAQQTSSANRSSKESDADREDARRDFHARNRADWVGVAHNRAIDEFRARLRRGEVTHDMCNDLVTFMSDERRMPDHATGGREERDRRAAVVRQTLRQSAFCGGQLAMGSTSELMSLTQAATLSPATQSLLDEVRAAAASATSSGDLAVALNPILAASAGLPTGEGDVVSAVASVAQSSMEYWEANLAATKRDYDRAYGSCAVGTASADDLALTCLGMSARGVLPTVYRGDGSSTLSLTQGRDLGYCNALNGREILGDDVKGGLGGAVAGFFATGGPGVIPGALVGAGASSLGAFAWQWAQTTFCVLGGGGGAKQPRPRAT